MKAHIDRDFKRGFFFNEEALIKIIDIIKKRLKEQNLNHNDLKFKIIRNDAVLFETNNYTDIINEENSKRNSIRKIEISFETEFLKFYLKFDKNENTNLVITSEEKDFAYLLFSDVKDYLQTEILTFRGFEFRKLKLETIVLPLVMTFFFIFVMKFMPNPSDNEINFVLQSDSIHKKLNFIIQTRAESSKMIDGDLIKFFTGFAILMFGVSYIAKLLDFVYPRNIFYFGKEIKKYDNLYSIRNKVIWGIIVALIISLVGGFIVWYFTN